MGREFRHEIKIKRDIEAYQWTSRLAVKNKHGIKREQNISFIWRLYFLI